MSERILRELAPQVVAAVARRHGRFDLAEDATQEALIAAAQQWPVEGVPEEPRGWLIAVATRRLIDALRAEGRGPGARRSHSPRSLGPARTSRMRTTR
jgi:predicted RNA polymerase sigma factor